jgi:hypothetical protein
MSAAVSHPPKYADRDVVHVRRGRYASETDVKYAAAEETLPRGLAKIAQSL